jgi:hypothetical protein
VWDMVAWMSQGFFYDWPPRGKFSLSRMNRDYQDRERTVDSDSLVLINASPGDDGGSRLRRILKRTSMNDISRRGQSAKPLAPAIPAASDQSLRARATPPYRYSCRLQMLSDEVVRDDLD